jgi:hypothetical protein
MLGFDKFMWSVPEIALAVLAYVGIIASALPLAATIAWAAVITIVFFVIYPLEVRRLARRRRRWWPFSSSDKSGTWTT